MSIKISELPQASTVNNTDVIPIVQDGTTKQATAELLKSINYSTNEQVVGTWTDGKPLYQKVITGTCPTVTLDGNEAHTDFTIDNNVSYSFVAESFMEMGSTNYRTSFPYDNFNYDSTFQTFTHMYTNAMLINNIVRIRNSSVANSGKTFYLVVHYTKTTD